MLGALSLEEPLVLGPMGSTELATGMPSTLVLDGELVQYFTPEDVVVSAATGDEEDPPLADLARVPKANRIRGAANRGIQPRTVAPSTLKERREQRLFAKMASLAQTGVSRGDGDGRRDTLLDALVVAERKLGGH